MTNKDGWIVTAERLPGDTEWVLVTVDDGGELYTATVEAAAVRDSPKLYIAWHPKPKPYKPPRQPVTTELTWIPWSEGEVPEVSPAGYVVRTSDGYWFEAGWLPRVRRWEDAGAERFASSDVTDYAIVKVPER